MYQNLKDMDDAIQRTREVMLNHEGQYQEIEEKIPSLPKLMHLTKKNQKQVLTFLPYLDQVIQLPVYEVSFTVTLASLLVDGKLNLENLTKEQLYLLIDIMMDYPKDTYPYFVRLFNNDVLSLVLNKVQTEAEHATDQEMMAVCLGQRIIEGAVRMFRINFDDREMVQKFQEALVLYYGKTPLETLLQNASYYSRKEEVELQLENVLKEL